MGFWTHRCGAFSVLPRGSQLLQMSKDIAWPHCTRTPKRSCCPDLSTHRCSSAKFVQISLCKCWYFSQGEACRTQAVKAVLIHWTADQFAAKHAKHTFHCTGLRSHCDVKKACLPGGSLTGKGIAVFWFPRVNSPVGAHLLPVEEIEHVGRLSPHHCNVTSKEPCGTQLDGLKP